MRTWFRKKDGVKYYTLPNCKICGRRSSTSDKETAQIAERDGRICRACTKDGNISTVNLMPPREDAIEIKSKKPLWKRIFRI